MSYVDDHLLPGERVVYRAHIHKLSFVGPLLLAILLIISGYALIASTAPIVSILLFAVALIPLLYAYILYKSSEFAVTDKRVIIKVGFIQRRTVETMLSKVEGIEVHQGILGRMMDFGTIVISGTGGTKESFRNIAAPLEFRRQVHGQISADPGTASRITETRDERDCPFCAERILTRAKVCKHCGREVEPLTT
jgi:uncharacterized membrane protein YdbT with pleckstrin-like domain